MRRRAGGKTILELMVIVSLMSVIFAGAATTLAALLRLDRQFRRDAEQTLVVARLASLLRGDAHEALSCRVDSACVLALPGGREVTYFAGDRQITRQVRRAGPAGHDAATEHFDTFRLPGANAISLTTLKQSGRDLVQLTIRQKGPAAAGTPAIQATRIEAAVNLPRREAAP